MQIASRNFQPTRSEHLQLSWKDRYLQFDASSQFEALFSPAHFQLHWQRYGKCYYWKPFVFVRAFLAWHYVDNSDRGKKRINSHFLCNNNIFDMNTGHIKNVVISIEEGIKTIYDLLAFVLCFFYFVVSILKVLRDTCTGPPQKCS